MRRFIGLLALTVMLPLTVWAEGPRDSIKGVILGQMQAFEAQDAEAAFAYASPKIKSIFGTAQNFADMVQRAYPMVWQHGDVRLLELREIAGGQWQKVLVTDGEGRGHVLDYQMIETPEGWQINAVQLLLAPDAGV